MSNKRPYSDTPSGGESTPEVTSEATLDGTPRKRAYRRHVISGSSVFKIEIPASSNQDTAESAAEALLSLSGAPVTGTTPPQASMIANLTQESLVIDSHQEITWDLAPKEKTTTRQTSSARKFVNTFPEKYASPPSKPPPKVDRVLNVLQRIQDQGFTLASFLEALFSSKDSKIVQRTHMFYHHSGPSQVIDIWSDNLRGKKADAAFVNSTIDVVVDRTRRELRRDGVTKTHLSSTSAVTPQSIEDFLINEFLDGNASNAVFLMRLLRGLTREDETKE